LIPLNSSNKIEVLPDDISELVTLIELDISNNEIFSLPEDIGNLSNLEKLFANANKLEGLPSSASYVLENILVSSFLFLISHYPITIIQLIIHLLPL